MLWFGLFKDIILLSIEIEMKTGRKKKVPFPLRKILFSILLLAYVMLICKSFFHFLRAPSLFSWRKCFKYGKKSFFINLIFHLPNFGGFFLLWAQFTNWSYLVGLLNLFLSVDLCITVFLFFFGQSRIRMKESAKR